MKRAQVLQEIRTMRFERVYTGWRSKKLTQEQAACILGVSDRINFAVCLICMSGFVDLELMLEVAVMFFEYFEMKKNF